MSYATSNNSFRNVFYILTDELRLINLSATYCKYKCGHFLDNLALLEDFPIELGGQQDVQEGFVDWLALLARVFRSQLVSPLRDNLRGNQLWSFINSRPILAEFTRFSSLRRSDRARRCFM